MSGFSTTWLLCVVFVLDVILAGVFVYFRSRKRKIRPQSYCFDFDQYKERELLRRGLCNRAKW